MVAETGQPSQDSMKFDRWLMDLKSVIHEVGSWPVEDRLRLIDEVWESLAGAPEAATLTQAHLLDLERRLDAYRDNPKAGSPWEEVEARLRGIRP